MRQKRGVGGILGGDDEYEGSYRVIILWEKGGDISEEERSCKKPWRAGAADNAAERMSRACKRSRDLD